MKVFCKITLLLVFAFSAQFAAGQLCGRYATKITVKDAGGNAVKDVSVKLKSLKKDETRGNKFEPAANDPSVFSITFNEGHQLASEYTLAVSAKGFNDFKTSLKFPHCIQRDFILKLARKNSDEREFFVQRKRLIFYITDGDEKAVEGVSVILTKQNAELEQVFSDKNGAAEFKITGGETFTVRFEKGGYKTDDVKLDMARLSFDRHYSRASMKIRLEKDEP